MTGRTWLLGIGLTLSAIIPAVLGWAMLMGYGEQAGWPHAFPPWFLPGLLAINLINLPLMVFNLRRGSRRS